jgi:hypothetical protein
MAGRSSRVAQCSASFPSTTRYQWLCLAEKRLPVGGITPLSLPVFVPSERTRAATMSPSATIASTVICKSGNWDRSHSTTLLACAGPFTAPGSLSWNGATACSMYSCAKISSQRSKSLLVEDVLELT